MSKYLLSSCLEIIFSNENDKFQCLSTANRQNVPYINTTAIYYLQGIKKM